MPRVTINDSQGLVQTTGSGVKIEGNLQLGGSVTNDMVTLTGDTTLTVAAHSGKTLLLGEVGGNAALTVTLPAATGTGAMFTFVISVVNTSNYLIKVADATDTIDGTILQMVTTAASGKAWTAGASDDTITLNGTTTGGVSIGDTLVLRDIASNQYTVQGVITGSGTLATMFSASVS